MNALRFVGCLSGFFDDFVLCLTGFVFSKTMFVMALGGRPFLIPPVCKGQKLQRPCAKVFPLALLLESSEVDVPSPEHKMFVACKAICRQRY